MASGWLVGEARQSLSILKFSSTIPFTSHHYSLALSDSRPLVMLFDEQLFQSSQIMTMYYYLILISNIPGQVFLLTEDRFIKPVHSGQRQEIWQPYQSQIFKLRIYHKCIFLIYIFIILLYYTSNLLHNAKRNPVWGTRMGGPLPRHCASQWLIEEVPVGMQDRCE